MEELSKNILNVRHRKQLKVKNADGVFLIENDPNTLKTSRTTSRWNTKRRIKDILSWERGECGLI